MGQVRITQHPDTGAIVNKTSNDDIYFVRVEQIKEVVNNGWLSDQKRSALIRGSKEKLEKKFKKHGQVVPGTITVRESIVREYTEKEPKINPSTREVLTKDGKAIYRYQDYNSDPNAPDGQLLEHDSKKVKNGEEQSETVNQEADISIT